VVAVADGDRDEAIIVVTRQVLGVSCMVIILLHYYIIVVAVFIIVDARNITQITHDGVKL